ncbi:MAG TPA: cupin domain-containing protein [Anaerolineales bacterium]|nr:cupin domain-containing protein [Anaerolineales bacterium]
MRTFGLLDGLEFRDKGPHSQPLYVDHRGLTGRILRFTLRPGQVIRQHEAPHSPVYIVVLQGEGMFAGGDGKEQLLGPGSLAVFDTGETHSVRAMQADLAFILFLHGVPEEITH